jgi:acyl-CoA thioester hydrolase
MAKPDSALLDPARYPFRCEIEPRFGDLDTNIHINNAALAGILEEARVRFHRAVDFHRMMEDMTSMVVSFSVEYIGQSHYPEPLEIHVAATNVGRTSHTLGQLVIQQGRLIAYAQTILVWVRNDRPQENSKAFRETINPWMLKS